MAVKRNGLGKGLDSLIPDKKVKPAVSDKTEGKEKKEAAEGEDPRRLRKRMGPGLRG